MGEGGGARLRIGGGGGQGGGKLVAGGKLNEESPSPHAIQKKMKSANPVNPFLAICADSKCNLSASGCLSFVLAVR